MEPRAAAEDYVRRVLIEPSAEIMLEASIWAVEMVSPLWRRALEAGVATLPLDAVQPVVLGRITRRPARFEDERRLARRERSRQRQEQLQDARSHVAADKLLQLMALQQGFDQKAVNGLRRTLQKSRQRGDSPAEQVSVVKAAVLAVINRLGDLVLRDVIYGIWQGILTRAAQDPVLEPVEPYQRYYTQGDDVVRPLHALLHDFVARTRWRGWSIITPPLEWNCRCFVGPVPFDEVAAAGWTADIPTLAAVQQLEAWLNAGGPDVEFPRGAFLGLAAA